MPLASGRTLALFTLVVAFAALFAVRPGPADAAGPSLRGVQLHSLGSSTSADDMRRELDSARDVGANVVRVDAHWAALEPDAKGRYSTSEVAKLDRFVNGADLRGLRVILNVISTPCWASSAPSNVKQSCSEGWYARGASWYPPTKDSDYGDIARWATGRYGTKLAAFEIWNEPNLENRHFWRTAPGAEAREYAALVKATYSLAKAGNSQVPVLAGSLATADAAFLRQLYAQGIKGSYDGLSVHPYNEWRDPADRWQGRWKQYTFLPGIESIKQVQKAAGDHKPLWLTEFGWTSCSGSGSCVSERKQADYNAKAFRLLEGMTGIKAAVTYNLREKGTDPASFEDNFGLINHDFSPKPGYWALRDALGGPGARKLRLSIVRRRKTVLAVVKGPRRARVALTMTRCSRASRRRFKVRTSRRGRARVRLGSRTAVRGCRVRARLVGKRAAAATRIR